MQIELKDLSLTYPNGKKALKSVNLSLKTPGMIGLLGPNGAGKSSLMKMLVASLLPSEGSITLNGQPLKEKENELKTALGYLPQDFGLFDELSVKEFLNYMAALKFIPDYKKAVSEVISLVNLEEKSKAKIRTLSGGQRQRVGIAQALLGDPELLIFDEPTVGLDPEERIHFRNLFSQKSRDKQVLLSTHIIEDVQSVCDYIIVIDHGTVLFTGTPSELIGIAVDHVGSFIDNDYEREKGLHVTSRVNTGSSICCKVVAEKLPDFVKREEPTLEEAYLYLISHSDSVKKGAR